MDTYKSPVNYDLWKSQEFVETRRVQTLPRESTIEDQYRTLQEGRRSKSRPRMRSRSRVREKSRAKSRGRESSQQKPKLNDFEGEKQPNFVINSHNDQFQKVYDEHYQHKQLMNQQLQGFVGRKSDLILDQLDTEGVIHSRMTIVPQSPITIAPIERLMTSPRANLSPPPSHKLESPYIVGKKHDHSRCSPKKDLRLSSGFEDPDSLQVQPTSHHLSYRSHKRDRSKSFGIKKFSINKSEMFMDPAENLFAKENKSPSMKDIRYSDMEPEQKNHEDHYSSCSENELVTDNSRDSEKNIGNHKKVPVGEKQKDFFEMEFEMIETQIRENVIRKREDQKSCSPDRKPPGTPTELSPSLRI